MSVGLSFIRDDPRRSRRSIVISNSFRNWHSATTTIPRERRILGVTWQKIPCDLGSGTEVLFGSPRNSIILCMWKRKVKECIGTYRSYTDNSRRRTSKRLWIEKGLTFHWLDHSENSTRYPAPAYRNLRTFSIPLHVKNFYRSFLTLNSIFQRRSPS